jgi:hypothetical protein
MRVALIIELLRRMPLTDPVIQIPLVQRKEEKEKK